MQWGGRIRQETNVDILNEARHYLDLVPNHGGKPSCQANLELQERGELPGPYRDPTQSSQESEPRGRISRTASDNASSGSPCRNSIRPNFNSDILPLDFRHVAFRSLIDTSKKHAWNFWVLKPEKREKRRQLRSTIASNVATPKNQLWSRKNRYAWNMSLLVSKT